MDLSLPPPSADHPLILASGSAYRAQLLGRLRVPFVQIASAIDETAGINEAPKTLAQRLAMAKAQAVSLLHPRRWILGSDQVCACAGRLLGKPGTRVAAIEQLTWLSGREALFQTAVALVNGAISFESTDTTVVRFRALEPTEIERYVDTEPALDCAGSFKSEGLGISLCEAIESEDPSALIGLPLIATYRLLARTGFAIP